MNNIFNRLKFVYHEEIFGTREEAYNYVLNRQVLERPTFVAEPMVLLYESEDSTKGPNVILAIGSVGNGVANTANRTFFIDTRKTEEELEALDEKLEEAIKSLSIVPLDSDTIEMHAEKTAEGTLLSGDVKIAEYRISGATINENIIEKDENGLYAFVDMDYDPETSIITFTNGKVTKEFQLPKDQHVVNGEYSVNKEAIILELADGTFVTIPVHQLIDEWTVLGEDSKTPIVLTREHVSGKTDNHGDYEWQDLLEADVRVASHIPDNILQKSGSGKFLYVKGTADNIKYKDGTVEDALDNMDTKVSTSKGNLIYKREDGIYAHAMLNYNAATNTLEYTYTENTSENTAEVKKAEFKLNSFNILEDITYNPVKEVIVIRYINNDKEYKTVEIPVSGIIEEWGVQNAGHSVELSKHRSEGPGIDLLSADVKIYEGDNNIVELKGDHGLYVNGISSNIKYDVTGDTTVKDVIDSLNTELNSTNDKLDAEIERATGVEQNLLDTIGTGFTSDEHSNVTAKFEELVANDKSLGDDIKSTNDKLDAEIERATGVEEKLEQDIDKNASDIDDLQKTIGTGFTSDPHENVTAKFEALEKTVNGIDGSIDDEVKRSTEKDKEHDERIEALEGDVNTISGDVESLKENIETRIYEVLPKDASVSTENYLEELDGIKRSKVSVNLSEYTNNNSTVDINYIPSWSGNDESNIIQLKSDGLHADVDLQYDLATNSLFFSKSGIEGVRKIQLQSNTIASEIKYDPVTEELIFIYTIEDEDKDNKVEHRVNLGSIITDWETKDSNSITLSRGEHIVNGKDVLTADVIVSSKDNNILTIITSEGDNGLYVSGEQIDTNTKAIAENKTAIESEVARATDVEGVLSGAIDANADAIVAEKNRAEVAEQNLLDTIGTGFTSGEASNITVKFDELNKKVDDEIVRSTEKDAEHDSAIESLNKAVSDADNNANDRIFDVRNFDGDNSLVVENVNATDEDKKHTNVKVNLSTIKGSETDTLSDLNIDRNNIIELLSDGLHADVDLQYNALTNTLYFSKTGSEGFKKIQLASDTIIKDIKYDATTEELILTYTVNGEDKDVKVGIRGILDEWRVSSTTTVELHKEVNHDLNDETHNLDILTAEVKISNEDGNIIEVKDGGLYVSNSGITKAEDDIKNLQDALKDEIDRAEAAESALDKKIQDEIDRATAAEGEIDTKVDANTKAIENLQDTIGTGFTSGEASNITAKFEELRGKVDSEIERSTGKDEEHDKAIAGLGEDLNAVSGVVDTLSANTDDRLFEVNALDTTISVSNPSIDEHGNKKHADIKVNVSSILGVDGDIDRTNIITVKNDGLHADVNLRYDALSNKLYFSKTGSEGETVFTLQSNQVVDKIYYDPHGEFEAIVIEYSVNGEKKDPVRIDVSKLIREWTVGNTNTIELIKGENDTTLSGDSDIRLDKLIANVKVSEDVNNAIEVHNDGLYVSNEGTIKNSQDITDLQQGLQDEIARATEAENSLSGAIDTVSGAVDTVEANANDRIFEVESLNEAINAVNIPASDSDKKHATVELVLSSNKGVVDGVDRTNILTIEHDGLHADVNLRYDKSKNKLYFSKTGADEIEIELQNNQVVDKIYYDKYAEPEALVIEYSVNGIKQDPVRVNVRDLINEWTVQPTKTITLKKLANGFTMEDDEENYALDLLTAEVNISSAEGNMIEVLDDGLYVSNKDIEQAKSDIEKAQGDIKDLQDALEAEIERSTDEDERLQDILGSGFTSTDSRDTVTQKFNELSGAVDSVSACCTANTEALEEEIKRAKDAESSLSGSIDSVSGAVDSVSACCTANTEALEEEIKRAKAAEGVISGAVDSVSACCTANTEALEEEIKRAKGAEKELQDTIGDGFSTDSRDTITQKFRDLTENVNNIDKTVTNHEERITNIEGDVKNLSADTADRVYEVNNLDASIYVDNVAGDETNKKHSDIKVNISKIKGNDNGVDRTNIITLETDGIHADVDLTYNAVTNTLYFSKTGSEGSKEIQLQANSIVDKIYYDPTIESIVIKYKVNGVQQEDVEIPMSSLISEWTTKNTTTVNLNKQRNSTVVDGQVVDELSAVVNISVEGTNMLETKDDGLFVSNSGITKNAKDIADLQKDLQDEVTRATEAENSLSGAIDSVEERVDDLESDLTDLEGKVDAEIERSTKADEVMSGVIDSHTEEIEDLRDTIGTGFTSEKGNTVTDKFNSLKNEFDVNADSRLTEVRAKDATVTVFNSEDGPKKYATVGVQFSEFYEERNIIQIAKDGIWADVNLTYNDRTNTLTFKKSGHPDIEIPLNSYSVVSSIVYNPSTESFDITYSKNGENSLSSIPVRKLIDEWDVTTSTAGAVKLTKTKSIGDGADILSAEVLISKDHTDNILEKKTDGLYVSNSGITKNAKDIADLQKDLQDEVTRAKGREKEIEDKLDAEITRSTNKDNELDTKIDNETTRAKGREKEIEDKLNSEITRSTNKDKELSDGLTAETQARLDDVADIYEAIDAITLTVDDTNSLDLTLANKVITGVVKINPDNKNIIKVDGEYGGLYANVSLEYDSATNKIRIKSSANVQDDFIQLNAVSILEEIYYDSETKKLVIKYKKQDGTTETVDVSVKEILNDWTVVNPTENSAVELTKVVNPNGATDELSARVKLSSREDNLVSIVDNALYVPGTAITEANSIAACTKSELQAFEKAVLGSRIAEECGSGYTYQKHTTSKYISGATSQHEADFMLDAAIQDLSGNMSTLSSTTETLTSNLDCLEKELNVTQENVLGMAVPDCGVKGDGGNFTYQPNEGTNYIHSATSFNNSDIILDRELKNANVNIEILSANTGAMQTEIDQIEASIGLAGDGTLSTFKGCVLGDNGPDTIVGAIQAFDSEICSLRESFNNVMVGSDTASAQMEVDKNGPYNKWLVNVRLSHGNAAIMKDGTWEEVDVEGLEGKAMVLVGDDLIISDYSGSTMVVEPGQTEFTDTNVLRIVDIKYDYTTGAEYGNPKLQANGLYLSNIWGCGLYTENGEGTYKNQYSTDDDEGASNYDYNNNVRGGYTD